MVMIAIYVDDCLTIATEEAIEEAINALKGHDFGLKVEDNLSLKETKRSFRSCNQISLTI
jgi:hypothetical protein